MSVLDVAYTYAEGFASDMPPARSGTLALRVSSTLAPHEHALRNLSRSALRLVVRGTTRRIAGQWRDAEFSRTDQYHYWTDEVAFLLGLAVESQALNGIVNAAKVARSWGMELSGAPHELAMTAPAYAFTGARTDILDQIADVLRCLPLLDQTDRTTIRDEHFVPFARSAAPPQRPYRPVIRRLCALMNGSPSEPAA